LATVVSFVTDQTSSAGEMRSIWWENAIVDRKS
jgi:hypothetical protein